MNFGMNACWSFMRYFINSKEEMLENFRKGSLSDSWRYPLMSFCRHHFKNVYRNCILRYLRNSWRNSSINCWRFFDLVEIPMEDLKKTLMQFLKGLNIKTFLQRFFKKSCRRLSRNPIRDSFRKTFRYHFRIYYLREYLKIFVSE